MLNLAACSLSLQQKQKLQETAGILRTRTTMASSAGEDGDATASPAKRAREDADANANANAGETDGSLIPEFPDEVFLEIISRLPLYGETLTKMRAVCKKWKKALSGDVFVHRSTHGLIRPHLLLIPTGPEYRVRSDHECDDDSFYAVDFQACVACDSSIAILGGLNLRNNSVPNFWTIDPIRRRIRRRADMIDPRHDFQATWMNGKIYALGGSKENLCLDTVESFSLTSSTQWISEQNLSLPIVTTATFVSSVLAPHTLFVNGEIDYNGPLEGDVSLSYAPDTHTCTRNSLGGIQEYQQHDGYKWLWSSGFVCLQKDLSEQNDLCFTPGETVSANLLRVLLQPEDPGNHHGPLSVAKPLCPFEFAHSINAFVSPTNAQFHPMSTIVKIQNVDEVACEIVAPPYVKDLISFSSITNSLDFTFAILFY